MKTEVLIRALAADAGRPVLGIGQLLGAALAAGTASSLVLFMLLLRPRADFAAAFLGVELPLKFAVVLCLAVSAACSLGPLSRPQARPAVSRLLAAAPLLLLLGMMFDLFTKPAEGALSRLVGQNALHCVTLIPLLSILPGLFLMLALRQCAPAYPGLAAAVVGLAAGGIGACLYALSCPEDSPLFVATWYSLAIAAFTALCFLVGRRWLRW
jgi:hypothetical protein